MTGILNMRKSTKKIPRIDWGNLRHDEELEKLLQPTRPIGAEFARKVERSIFEFLLEYHVAKIYIWDDFHSDGNIMRYDWHYGACRPEGHACRELDLKHLVDMDDEEFERLVWSLPKSSNEQLVRQWRKEMRSGAGMVPSTGLRQELETPDALDPIFKEKLL